ncbi:MAG: hypothetical protein WC346_09170 [Methanogenium sp.]
MVTNTIQRFIKSLGLKDNFKMKKSIIISSILSILSVGFPKNISNFEFTKDITYNEYKFKEEKNKIMADTISAPYFKIKPYHCSEYVVKSAKHIFDKEYNLEDAWNLRYKNNVISEITNYDDFLDKISKMEIPEGSIIGFYNPHSAYNYRKDFSGKKIKYSHVGLYIGLDSLNNPQIIHQWNKHIEKISLEKLLTDKQLRPIEVISYCDNIINSKK